MTDKLPNLDRVLTPSERKAMMAKAARSLSNKKALLRSHAAMPGTGPDGQTCRSCAHLSRVEHAKTYLKCGLMSEQWTGGPGTDVRARDPACENWMSK